MEPPLQLYYQHQQSSYSRPSTGDYWTMNQRADSHQQQHHTYQNNQQQQHWNSIKFRRGSGPDFYPVPTGDRHQPTLPPLNRYHNEPNTFDSGRGRHHDSIDSRDHHSNSDLVGADDLSLHSTSPHSASGTALPHHHQQHHSHAVSSTVYQSGMTTTTGGPSSSTSPKSRQHKQRDTYSTSSVPRTHRTKPSLALRGVDTKLPRQQRGMSDPSVNHRLDRMLSDGHITPSDQIWNGNQFTMSGRGERTTYSPETNSNFSVPETRQFSQVDAGGPNRLNYPPVVSGSPNAGVSDSRIPAHNHGLSAGIDAAKHYSMPITSTTTGAAVAAAAAINQAQFVPPALASPDHHQRSSTLDVNLQPQPAASAASDASQYGYSSADVPFAPHGAYDAHLDNSFQPRREQQPPSSSSSYLQQNRVTNQSQQPSSHDVEAGLLSFYSAVTPPTSSSPSSSSNLVIRSPPNMSRPLSYWPHTMNTPTITVSEPAYPHPSTLDKVLEMHQGILPLPSTYMHNPANLQSPLHVPSPPSDWSDAERSSMRLPGRLPGQRVDVDPKMLLNSFVEHDDESKIRRAILDDIQQQDWFRQHLKEPTIETRNDPLARGLGTVGRSIYTVFLVEDKESNQWRCLFGSKGNPCKKSGKQFERVERAIEHVRSHLGHRPFACDNTCHKSSSAGTPCGKRFFAAGYLEDHKRRPQKRTGSS